MVCFLRSPLSVPSSQSSTVKLDFRGKIKYFCLRTPFKLWNDCCHWNTYTHFHSPPPLYTHTHTTLPWFWMDRWLGRGGWGGLKYIISWKEWGPLGFSQSGPSLHWGWGRVGECWYWWWCVCVRWEGGDYNMATPHCNLSQKGANLSYN